MNKTTWLIIITILIVAACTTIPGTNKRAFLLFSENKMNSMGYQAYSQIKNKEKINRDPRLNAILQRVGQRISAVAEAKHRVGYKWSFTLIESKEPNAFCLPGGKVAFYTGMLPILQNEAAMAVVMGHEVAHATLQHGNQRMSQGTLAQMGLAASAITFRNSQHRNMIMAGLGIGTQVGVMLPFSRSHESEADVYGLEYAAKAGYDPREAAKFWMRFSAKTAGGSPPEFLSTHPASSSRIRKLKNLESQALTWYQSSARYGSGAKL